MHYCVPGRWVGGYYCSIFHLTAPGTQRWPLLHVLRAWWLGRKVWTILLARCSGIGTAFVRRMVASTQERLVWAAQLWCLGMWLAVWEFSSLGIRSYGLWHRLQLEAVIFSIGSLQINSRPKAKCMHHPYNLSGKQYRKWYYYALRNMLVKGVLPVASPAEKLSPV